MTTNGLNVSAHLFRVARDRPYAPAIFAPQGRDGQGRMRYVHWTYEQLAREVRVLSKGLRAFGIERGTPTVLMVPPSLELFGLVFALFEVGAPVIMADPGMGPNALGMCLERARPRALVGVAKAHAARALFRWRMPELETRVLVGPSWTRPLATAARAVSLDRVRARGESALDHADGAISSDALAAILFTSGSTGTPKGALYTHGMFSAQVEAIRSMFDIQEGEIDVPTFPLFALFDPALGMSTVIPEMDATRPARANPKNIIDAVEGFGATNMFGSPALLDTVARWAVPRGVRLPTLRRVLTAGAPVDSRIVREFSKLLGEGVEIHTPYGATECLPVSSIGSTSILTETAARTARGEGICVGTPVPSVEVGIVEITDAPLSSVDDASLLPRARVGELVVRAPHMSPSYLGQPEADRLAKVHWNGELAHRMGDLGRIDEEGRIWFYGRKAHRVELEDGRLLFSVACEGPVDADPRVKRSALVGALHQGRTVPVICVELRSPLNAKERASLLADIRSIIARHEHMKGIERIFIHPGFPVDVRHNAKIRREDLVPWTSEQLVRTSA